MRCVILLLLAFFCCISMGNCSDKISKDLLEKIFTNALYISSEGSSDQAAYSKILRGNFKNSITKSKITESSYKNVVQIKKITLGITDLVVFKEKSINGTLFIANSRGDIIFSAPEWAEEFNVIYPYQSRYNFVVTKILYNDNTSNDNENRKIYHVFELQSDESLINVLSYTDSINFCLHNNLLPTNLKKQVEEKKKFFTACSAKAKIKKFNRIKVDIDFTYTIEKDFLTDVQYQEVLDYYKFPKSGKKILSWSFERDGDSEPYEIYQGDETSPLNASNLAIKNY